jgi:hypothetical protein
MRVCPTRSFSRNGGTAFTARTILALVRTCPMVAFASRFQTQPLSINSSTREAWRTRRLSSVDGILPDIEFQLYRRDSRLGFLGDSFVFNGKPLLGLLREDAGSLSAVERRHSGAQAPVKFPQPFPSILLSHSPTLRSGSADMTARLQSQSSGTSDDPIAGTALGRESGTHKKKLPHRVILTGF